MIGIIATLVGQLIAQAVTRTVLARRAAQGGQTQASPPASRRTAANAANPPQSRRPTARDAAQRLKAQRASLSSGREASYQSLIAADSIRPVPSVRWLSKQPVVCAHGHRSSFGLFATLPGYGTLSNLPDIPEVESGWRRRAECWKKALLRRPCATVHPIHDRDPQFDGRWCLACPTCGTETYSFEAEALQEYVMCPVSPDLFWLCCHLHQRRLGGCAACEVRRKWWAALRVLE